MFPKSILVSETFQNCKCIGVVKVRKSSIVKRVTAFEVDKVSESNVYHGVVNEISRDKFLCPGSLGVGGWRVTQDIFVKCK